MDTEESVRKQMCEYLCNHLAQLTPRVKTVVKPALHAKPCKSLRYLDARRYSREYVAWWRQQKRLAACDKTR